MSTTGQIILNRSLRLIGAIPSGGSPTTGESADGLVAINAMIEAWEVDKLFVYAFVDTAYTLVAATNSYTVGPSGNFNLTPRPDKIETCFVRNSNTDYDIEIIESDRWFSIPDKTATSNIPMYAYYEPSLITGTLLLWPIPNTAYPLHIVTWTTVQSIAALSTTMTLPPGYERAMAYNLAIELAPEYGASVSKEVMMIAQQSKATIKRANQRPIISRSVLGHLFRAQRSNILSGG